MKSVTYWYQFFTRCEELVPIIHGMKFTKCEIYDSTQLTLFLYRNHIFCIVIARAWCVCVCVCVCVCCVCVCMCVCVLSRVITFRNRLSIQFLIQYNLNCLSMSYFYFPFRLSLSTSLLVEDGDVSPTGRMQSLHTRNIRQTIDIVYLLTS